MAMKSEIGRTLFASLQAEIRTCLQSIDSLEFETAKAAVQDAKAKIKAEQETNTTAVEDALNDVACASFLADLLLEYATFWERVSKKEYEQSWMALQDALDSIRVLKRLSSIDVSRFENQLAGLEKTYPYKVFASMGCIAGRIECSICGNDIDSLECPHRRGYLYAGKMAYGIVKEIKTIDHVALTEHPEDKRCIMKVEGRNYSFPAVDWLAQNLSRRNCVVSDFSHVEMSERRKRNPEVIHQKRNEKCRCNSGKKFKDCCAEKEYITYPHAHFVFRGNPKLIQPE